MQTKNLLLIGDFNAPNVNWNDMTTSYHDATFDARILSLCLDNFLVQHSVRATRSVLGQRETCLDLVFTKTAEDILSFDRGQPLGNSDHLSICFDYVCFLCTNPSYKKQRNIWKGGFEGMRRHLHLQDWNLLLVGDIETKWLRFKAVLLVLVENLCPLARSPSKALDIKTYYCYAKAEEQAVKKIPAYTLSRALSQLQTP